MSFKSRFLSNFPLLEQLPEYRGEQFIGDLIAGTIVAIMLIPQAMAYAMLAGLPPQVGLYASILPLIVYSFLGSSRSLAVGPVAMVSLLVVSGISELAEPGSDSFIQHCLTLAFLCGLMQVALSVFRMGFLVNFISHPVLVGFTSAAAIIIAFSQGKHLMGVELERSEAPYELILTTGASLFESNVATLLLGIGGIVLILIFNFQLASRLQWAGMSESLAKTLSRLGPLFAVVLASVMVFVFRMDQRNSVAIVGEIVPGLPEFSLPDLRWQTIRPLLPLALVITLVGYLESISVSKSLASRRREKVDADREFLALGFADLAAAITSGYPVTGGFSRTMVNFSAGVRSQWSSVITAGLVALSVVFLTPVFYYIPKTVLAAIIVVAVIGLVDFKTPIRLWRFSRPDAIALMITFGSVLAWGIESGILIGVIATVLLLVWRMSRPHIAEVGRMGDSEHFRNVLRHPAQPIPGLLAVRIDQSLNFANAPVLENFVLGRISERPDVKQVLLIGSGINEIDATGIEVIEAMDQELAAAEIRFCLSDIKGPVMDRLERSGISQDLLISRTFLSAHEAIRSLTDAGQTEPENSTQTQKSSRASNESTEFTNH